MKLREMIRRSVEFHHEEQARKAIAHDALTLDEQELASLRDFGGSTVKGGILGGIIGLITGDTYCPAYGLDLGIAWHWYKEKRRARYLPGGRYAKYGEKVSVE